MTPHPKERTSVGLDAVFPLPADGGWCILRTRGPATLPLARSLADAGIDIWTPTAEVTKRKPRSRTQSEIKVPILPTFVFARAAHLPELRRCLSLPSNPHPRFSIFHYCGRVPVVAESDIACLRNEEYRAKRDAQRRHPSERPTFQMGERVRCKDGAWAGLGGIVEQEAGGFVLVDFGGTRLVKIDTFLLDPDDVRDSVSERAPRHRNAAKYLRPVPSVGKALSEKCEACNDGIVGREAVEAAPRP